MGGGILQEEVGSVMTDLRAVGTLVVVGDMAAAGMSSEARVSFLGDPGVLLGAMERITSGPIRMEVEGEGSTAST